MIDTAFKDAALGLLGHGTELNTESKAPVYQPAAAIRAIHRFAEVREAFWKQEPQAKSVLAEIRSTRLFIVPFFVSEGYFSEVVIPRELGFLKTHDDEHLSRVRRRENQTVYYCRAIGGSDAMTEIILARAR